jgi:hypothetical protein
LHEREPIVVKLAVGALPTGEHAGGGVQERRRVGGACNATSEYSNKVNEHASLEALLASIWRRGLT